MNRIFSLLVTAGGAVVVALVATACTGPAIGGGIGGVVLLVGMVLLFLLGGTAGCTPAGCTEVQACLSIDEPPPPDVGDTGDADAADTGDTDGADAADTGDDDAGDEDVDGGDDTDAGDEDAGASLEPAGDERDEILARMRDRLPEDVAARLEEEA